MKTDGKDGRFPLAMDPPEGNVTLINAELMGSVLRMSQESPRKRIIFPFHKSDEANPHRMLNAIQPGSYIRPHRHHLPPKTETMIVLQGAIAFLTFDDLGEITDATVLSSRSGIIGVDSEPDIYHTFLVLEPDTVLFEVKPGPYRQSSDKDFAQWAPSEGSEAVAGYMASLQEQIRDTIQQAE